MKARLSCRNNFSCIIFTSLFATIVDFWARWFISHIKRVYNFNDFHYSVEFHWLNFNWLIHSLTYTHIFFTTKIYEWFTTQLHSFKEKIHYEEFSLCWLWKFKFSFREESLGEFFNKIFHLCTLDKRIIMESDREEIYGVSYTLHFINLWFGSCLKNLRNFLKKFKLEFQHKISLHIVYLFSRKYENFPCFMFIKNCFKTMWEQLSPTSERGNDKTFFALPLIKFFDRERER